MFFFCSSISIGRLNSLDSLFYRRRWELTFTLTWRTNIKYCTRCPYTIVKWSKIKYTTQCTNLNLSLLLLMQLGVVTVAYIFLVFSHFTEEIRLTLVVKGNLSLLLYKTRRIVLFIFYTYSSKKKKENKNENEVIVHLC